MTSLVTRSFGRLRAMDTAELRFRAATGLRKLHGRARSAMSKPAWRREEILRLLHPDAVAASPHLGRAQRAARAGDWSLAHHALATHLVVRTPRFPLNPQTVASLADRIRWRFPQASASAAAQADRMLDGRYDLLGYEDLDVGRPPRWHADPVHHCTAPLDFWSRVPYLDPQCGDHKIIWELNRHQHWLVLGRAYHLTGDRRYYQEFVSQLGDWLEANPPLLGVNWASMLELGFRCLSWLWALHFFAEAALDDGPDAPPWTIDMVTALDRQLTHVDQNLSRYFSPNTHLTGEALALFAAGCALPELMGSARRAAAGRTVLLDEAERQVCADGGHVELSAHYHRYSTDFYLFALALARAVHDPARESLERSARRQAEYLRTIADDSGRLPLLGDDDGGRLFPICAGAPSDCRSTLAASAVLLAAPDLAVGEIPEETFWLCGDFYPLGRLEGPGGPWPSKALTDTGYFVIRTHHRDHLVFDAGPHGYLNGGHAHADALSIVLTVADRPLLIDPGTATYTMDAAMRDRFRGTAMHNTVVVNGRSQSEPDGPFHWRTRASARARIWQTGERFDYVEGSHDGYAPIVHVRSIVALPEIGWIVVDHLLGTGTATADIRWHLSPDWSVTDTSRDAVALQHADGTCHWIASTWPLEATDDDAGCAPVYGRIRRSTFLRGHVAGPLPQSVCTFVPTARQSLDPCTIASIAIDRRPGEPWHTAGFDIRSAQRDIRVLCATDPDGVSPAPDSPWGTAGVMTNGRVVVSVTEPGRLPVLIRINDAGATSRPLGPV